jgi:hypothetical protein
MSHAEQMQDIYHRYRREKKIPPDQVLELSEVYDFATQNNLWGPHRQDLVSQFTRDMALSLRQEMEVGAHGEPVRVNFAVRKKQGEKQLTLWGGIDMSFEDLEVSCQQRRIGIAHVCRRLNNDVEHINAVKNPKRPIQIVWDFGDDILEMKAAKEA